MFSLAAKSVVKNFGQGNYYAGNSSLKNTRALVLAAEKSRVPGIRTTLVEQTAEKPVLNSATTSEQNGLVAFPAENNSRNEETRHSVTNEKVTPTLGSASVEAQQTQSTCESILPQGLKFLKSEAQELLGIINELPAKEEHIIDANQKLRSYPVSNFSQHLGISKQLKTPGADMCSRYQDVTYAPKEERRFILNSAHREAPANHISQRQELPLRILHQLVTIKPTSDSGGSRYSTDDHFPLGKEYEDELGPGWSDQVERIPAQKSSKKSASHLSLIDEERDYFLPMKVVSRYYLREHGMKIAADYQVRNMIDGEAHERLQALQKKVKEFKQKLFRLRGDDTDTKKLDPSPATQEPNKDGSQNSDTTGGQNFVPTIV